MTGERAAPPCPVCGAAASFACSRRGRVPPVRDYDVFTCPSCRFSFIPDYRTDYEVVYSEDYYKGKGADPLVNYLYDHEAPGSTLRAYEWEGLVRIFRSLAADAGPGARWLDYGCGMGSLVRHAAAEGIDCFGYEPFGGKREGAGEGVGEGVGVGLARRILSDKELSDACGFDFVSAIEVIEHAPDPLSFLRSVRALMRPGGILFLTTGNAAPFRGRLDRWSYAGVPDVHMSFFEPGSLALAMEKTGFSPSFAGYVPGFTDVIKYKILKNLGFRRRSRLFGLLPWFLLSRLADLKFKVTAMPAGIAA